MTSAEIEAWLVTHLAHRLQVATADIDPRQPFVNFGLGSREAIRVTGELEEHFGMRLSPTLFWEFPTIEALASHLSQALAIAIRKP